MILPIFFFILPFALWWAILWLAVPVDWDALNLPRLVLLHVAPPIGLILSWGLFKRLRKWRTERRERLAKEKEKAEEGQTRAANLAEHHRQIEARRAHVECRGVWASLTSPPKWGEKLPYGYTFLEHDAAPVDDFRQDGAFSELLQQVFESAFSCNEALPYLPIRLAATQHQDAAKDQLEWVTRAWERAILAREAGPKYLRPDCKILPGTGNVAGRVIALFENAPTIPAILLLGVGPTPDDAPRETGSGDGGNSKPGHAIVAVLLSRPGLAAMNEEAAPPPPPPDGKEPDMAPYWERPPAQADVPGAWGRVPIVLQPGFLTNLPPLAKLARSRLAVSAERPNASMRRLHLAIEEAFIDAGLRDLPFKEEKKDGQDTAKAEQDAPDAPEIGWLVHDSPDLSQIGSALHESKSDLSLWDNSASVLDMQGHTGSAHGVLMSALALTRAAQLQKAVLLAETIEKNGTNIAFAYPCKQDDAPATA